jgi:hypothetical protein
MSEQDRLKEFLDEIKREVQEMDDWLKLQEPSPGVSYEDWIRESEYKKAMNKPTDG